MCRIGYLSLCISVASIRGNQLATSQQQQVSVFTRECCDCFLNANLPPNSMLQNWVDPCEVIPAGHHGHHCHPDHQAQKYLNTTDTTFIRNNWNTTDTSESRSFWTQHTTSGLMDITVIRAIMDIINTTVLKGAQAWDFQLRFFYYIQNNPSGPLIHNLKQFWT